MAAKVLTRGALTSLLIAPMFAGGVAVAAPGDGPNAPPKLGDAPRPPRDGTSPVADPAPPVAVEIGATAIAVDGQPAVSTDGVFEVGEATLKPGGKRLLDAVAAAIQKAKDLSVRIEVSTDATAPDGDGSGEWLRKLSEARAATVKAHLVKKGVAASKLSTLGLGASRPGRDAAASRRIELLVEKEVRAPLAADLALYTKDVTGAGPLTATFETSQGTLRCELFGDQAPATVANFIGLATGKKAWVDPRSGKTVHGKPLFDGLVFHRVIPDFMIQGGDPLGVGTGGPGYTFDDEIVPTLHHEPGALAMANAGPSTNGSQFFIDEVAAPHLDGHHTVFGKCRELDVIRAIAHVPRNSSDVPLTPVVIKHVKIKRGG
jgi:cyclophilin family peptidyl-prolyl cis-trans isomerase/outer membrane protein OmpA-like peptidoglycan-associated protein